MRAENYSKKGTSLGTSGWGISNFLTLLDENTRRTKALSILVDIDAPLEEQSILLANKVNKLKEIEDCKKITTLGISKCGTMVISMLKYLNDLNLDKLNLLTYQAPYLGTIFASPNILYEKVDETIENMSDNLLKIFLPHLQKIKPISEHYPTKSDKVDFAKVLKDIHWNVFSQSHMDYDISLVGEDGVPDIHKDRYDENYLKNLFNEETLSKLKQVNFTNITTSCSKKTMENSLKTLNMNALMLYLSSRILFDEICDGMVPLKSSQYIEQVCKQHNIPISTLFIKDGHHDIASDPRIIREIMQQKVLNIDDKEDVLSR